MGFNFHFAVAVSLNFLRCSQKDIPDSPTSSDFKRLYKMVIIKQSRILPNKSQLNHNHSYRLRFVQTALSSLPVSGIELELAQRLTNYYH